MATYTTTLPRTNTYAVAKMLQFAKYKIVLGKFGMVTPLPRNRTDNVKWRRPVPKARATTPLTEGVTPSASAFTYDDISATLGQYGDWSAITDKIADLHEDPVLNNIIEVNGDQAGGTIERVTWGVIRAGTNVFFANGTARGDVNTPISLAAQRAVVRELRRGKADQIAKMLTGSVKINTTPVERSYVAFTHTDVENDIRELAGFRPVSEYGPQTKLLHDQEIGKVENVRYIISEDLDSFPSAGGVHNGMVTTDTVNADVYPIIYIGKDAFGTVALSGSNAIDMLVRQVGDVTDGDELAQRGSAGWKTWHAAAILNEDWLARLEVGATELV